MGHGYPIDLAGVIGAWGTIGESREGERQEAERSPSIRNQRRWILFQLDIDHECNYSNYMRTKELKIARIGNSRGVRLPAATLDRFRIGAVVIMEETAEGILLRPRSGAPSKLSWEETARAMAASPEDWGDLMVADADGLDSIPWENKDSVRIAEPRVRFQRHKPARRRG